MLLPVIDGALNPNFRQMVAMIAKNRSTAVIIRINLCMNTFLSISLMVLSALVRLIEIL